jgi:hypothetical protein
MQTSHNWALGSAAKWAIRAVFRSLTPFRNLCLMLTYATTIRRAPRTGWTCDKCAPHAGMPQDGVACAAGVSRMEARLKRQARQRGHVPSPIRVAYPPAGGRGDGQRAGAGTRTPVISARSVATRDGRAARRDSRWSIAEAGTSAGGAKRHARPRPSGRRFGRGDRAELPARSRRMRFRPRTSSRRSSHRPSARGPGGRVAERGRGRSAGGGERHARHGFHSFGATHSAPFDPPFLILRPAAHPAFQSPPLYVCEIHRSRRAVSATEMASNKRHHASAHVYRRRVAQFTGTIRFLRDLSCLSPRRPSHSDGPDARHSSARWYS